MGMAYKSINDNEILCKYSWKLINIRTILIYALALWMTFSLVRFWIECNQNKSYLWGYGRERNKWQVFPLLREVSVGDSEAQDLRQVGQLLLGRHTLARSWQLRKNLWKSRGGANNTRRRLFSKSIRCGGCSTVQQLFSNCGRLRGEEWVRMCSEGWQGSHLCITRGTANPIRKGRFTIHLGWGAGWGLLKI